MQITSQDIYLDYNATTPVDPQVFKVMEPYFLQHFGNPASAGHHWGWAAESAVTSARTQVAQLIGAKPQEIVFTSSATESNNWVIFGLIAKLREQNPQEPLHFITSTVEHSSVMKAMEAAQRMGVEVDFLPVNSFGQVELETVRKAIKPTTKLMSFIWVNNEVGSINPISEIATLCRQNKILLHADATQAVGKISMNMMENKVDLMSFSGHKIYGPKGVGALFMRSSEPKVQLSPLLFGGGQERGIRSGTLNVPGIVGLGAAAELCQLKLMYEADRLTKLRDHFWDQLQKSIPGVRLNGHPTLRAPNNLNITLPGIKTERLVGHLQKIGFSTGSACGTGAMVISHVLKAMGLSDDEIKCSLRLSLGRWTSPSEVDRALEILIQAIKKVS